MLFLFLVSKIKTSSKLQPADWEEKEYIEDPDDFKPEVFKSSNISVKEFCAG